MKILCGIVTFNPNIDRLKENVDAVVNQVDHLLIFDNNSSNINELKEFADYNNISLFCNQNNDGIAHALKYIMQYSIDNKYDWVLSLDQDTVVNNDLIENYKKYTNVENVGAVTCNYKDRNTDELEFKMSDTEVEIEGCITSGFFLKITAYQDTQGYDEDMFIDGVDFDICNALRRKKYKIIRIPFVGFLHELGNSRIFQFGNKKIKVWNHSSFRKYYIFRNAIYVARKYPEYYSIHKEIEFRFKDLLKIILFENNKIDKLKKSINGMYDGFKMEI